MKILSIPSDIPGWYDKSWPGFKKPKSWKGCRVRVHVKIADKDYERKLDRARRSAERKYKDATITVKPDFDKFIETREDSLELHSEDSHKISKYISDTLPENLRERSEKIVALVTSKLNEAERTRRGTGKVEFEKIKGKNVLSFKDVSCDFTQKGIVAVDGRNEDWNGQSNGSGKTSYINLIPVAISGTTFKGEKSDKWARRHTNDSALVELYLRDEHKRKIKIIRGRRPTKLQLIINGVDNSSGMNRSKKIGTQEHIEAITGLNWKMLANSIYIDKKTTDAFLEGTKKDRSDLLYSFLNLERFEVALKLIKKYHQNHNLAMQQTESSIDILKGRIEQARENLHREEYRTSKSVEPLREQYQSRLKSWKTLHSQNIKAARKAKRTQKKLEPRYYVLTEKASQLDAKVKKLGAIIDLALTTLQKHKHIVRQGNCPTCGAVIDSNLHEGKIKDTKREIEEAKERKDSYKKQQSSYELRAAELEAKIDGAKIEAGEIKTKYDQEYIWVKNLKAEILRLKEREASRASELKNKLKGLKELKHGYNEYLASLHKDEEFIDYCERTFSRDGIPAWLIRQLTPTLTKAAEYFSDLFVDRTFTIRFKDNSGIEPEIIYPDGGGTLASLSMGERAMAALIVSLALKEISPRTNVLILDEPGHGMTDYNLKRVAEGLKKLTKKFRTIFVITHQEALLSALQNEKVITIVKKNKISRVESNYGLR